MADKENGILPPGRVGTPPSERRGEAGRRLMGGQIDLIVAVNEPDRARRPLGHTTYDKCAHFNKTLTIRAHAEGPSPDRCDLLPEVRL